MAGQFFSRRTEGTVGAMLEGSTAGLAKLQRIREFRILLMGAIYIIGLRIQDAWQESEFEREPVTGYSVGIWKSKKPEDVCSWSKWGFRV